MQDLIIPFEEPIRLTFAEEENHQIRSDTAVNHCHNTYEILYVVEGNGRFVIEGGEVPVNPGTVLFAKPFEHHYTDMTYGEAYVRYALHFNESVLSEDAKALVEDRFLISKPYFKIMIEPQGPIANAFKRATLSNQMPPQNALLYLNGILSELISLLPLAEKSIYSIDEESLNIKVLKYLDSCFNLDNSIDELAKKFNVSKSHLCHEFKQNNAISPHEYITRKRVLIAKQLIDKGESATSIYKIVGFNNYPTFYRAYVKILNKAPSEN